MTTEKGGGGEGGGYMTKQRDNDRADRDDRASKLRQNRSKETMTEPRLS